MSQEFDFDAFEKLKGIASKNIRKAPTEIRFGFNKSSEEPRLFVGFLVEHRSYLLRGISLNGFTKAQVLLERMGLTESPAGTRLNAYFNGCIDTLENIRDATVRDLTENYYGEIDS